MIISHANPTKEERRRRLVKVLSSVNTKKIHERIRRSKHLESCQWMFSTTEYQSWIESDRSAVLCCDGIRKSKSIMAHFSYIYQVVS